jgi:hypothetical protein
VDRLRGPESPHQNKDSDQKVNKADDLQIQAQALDSLRRSRDDQGDWENVVAPFDGVFRLRPWADVIEDLNDLTIAFNGTLIDHLQNVPDLNSRALCRAVWCQTLSLYNSIINLNPGTAIFGSDPLSFLLDVEPADYEQSDRERYCKDQPEEMNLSIFRNGY